ncbi:protein starmaker-like [Paramacrobiotus metropolitanus]|uniref:protein starmaker-like n=1 Tax=Paramacrobiotus metropolitanus TaxID=2943436 RepID=UPI002445F872|nr:protein starmaker-like [Paramacrobiotus metropolitanus]
MHSADFRFQSRGVIDIKGKGPQKCYWLLQEHEKDDFDMWTDPISHHSRRPQASPHGGTTKGDRSGYRHAKREESESEQSVASRHTQQTQNYDYQNPPQSIPETRNKESPRPAPQIETSEPVENNRQKKFELFASDKKQDKKTKDESKLLTAEGHSKSPEKKVDMKRRGSKQHTSKDLGYFADNVRHKEEVHSPLHPKDYKPTLLPADDSGYAQVSYFPMTSDLFHANDHTKSSRQSKDDGVKTPVHVRRNTGKSQEKKPSVPGKIKRDKSDDSVIRSNNKTDQTQDSTAQRREKSAPGDFLQLPFESGSRTKKLSAQGSLGGQSGNEQDILSNFNVGADSLKADLQIYQTRSDKKRKKKDEREKRDAVPVSSVDKSGGQEATGAVADDRKSAAAKLNDDQKKSSSAVTPDRNLKEEGRNAKAVAKESSATTGKDETAKNRAQHSTQMQKTGSEIPDAPEPAKRRSQKENKEIKQKNKKSVVNEASSKKNADDESAAHERLERAQPEKRSKTKQSHQETESKMPEKKMSKSRQSSEEHGSRHQSKKRSQAKTEQRNNEEETDDRDVRGKAREENHKGRKQKKPSVMEEEDSERRDGERSQTMTRKQQSRTGSEHGTKHDKDHRSRRSGSRTRRTSDDEQEMHQFSKQKRPESAPRDAKSKPTKTVTKGANYDKRRRNQDEESSLSDISDISQKTNETASPPSPVEHKRITKHAQSKQGRETEQRDPKQSKDIESKSKASQPRKTKLKSSSELENSDQSEASDVKEPQKPDKKQSQQAMQSRQRQVSDDRLFAGRSKQRKDSSVSQVSEDESDATKPDNTKRSDVDAASARSGTEQDSLEESEEHSSGRVQKLNYNKGRNNQPASSYSEETE